MRRWNSDFIIRNNAYVVVENMLQLEKLQSKVRDRNPVTLTKDKWAKGES